MAEIKEILTDNSRVLFKFECEKCGKIIHINVIEILDIGYPLCCDDREMEIDQGVYVKI